MRSALFRFLPRSADYDRRSWRADLLAGITVAVVALPLALGFGVTSGAGAGAGLITAAVAGILAGVFGGSNLQVSGPTGAMTVVLLPLVAEFGVAALAPVGLLAGAFLLLLAFMRVGRLVRVIPYPVITGFTAGIAVIIFLQQVPAFLGVPAAGGEQILAVTWATIRNAGAPGWPTLALGALTIVVMVGWGRVERLRALPASMAALVVATATATLPAFAGVAHVAAIPTGLPTPSLPSLGGMNLTDLVRAALVIAALAALESLLSAVVADGMTISERHDPDRELFGQGVANLGSAVLGGIPATAALARTAVNVRSGARTRLAAIVHGVVLAAVMLVLAPLAGRIPLVVLAAILVVVALRMIDVAECREILRSGRSDAVTLVLTFGVTVAFDLILAIEVGFAAAAVLFIARMSRLMQIDLDTLDGGSAPVHQSGAAAAIEEAVRRDGVVVFHVAGPLFFGAADRFFEELLRVDDRIRVVVLRFRDVPAMDISGAAALRSLVKRLAQRNVVVMMSRVQDQPREILERSGILAEVTRHGNHLFDTTEAAIAHAREHAAGADHTHPARAAAPAVTEPT